LPQADPPSKESYRLHRKDYGSGDEARAQQRAVEPLMNKYLRKKFSIISVNVQEKVVLKRASKILSSQKSMFHTRSICCNRGSLVYERSDSASL
jgi:hypothetical protein